MSISIGIARLERVEENEKEEVRQNCQNTNDSQYEAGHQQSKQSFTGSTDDKD